MDNRQPVPIGIASEHKRLQALAERHGYRVFRVNYAHAADPRIRARPDGWSIAAVDDAGTVKSLVFDGDTPEVEEFLGLAALGIRLLDIADLAAAAVAGESQRETLEQLLDNTREIAWPTGWSDLTISVQGLRQALLDTLAVAITAHGRLGSRLGSELAALEGLGTVKREAALLRRLLRGSAENP